MSKLMDFTHNVFAVAGLFALVTLATLTTVALSPAARGDRVSGVTTTRPSTILSNYIPIQVKDDHELSVSYVTQLLGTSDGNFTYVAKIGPSRASSVQKPFVTIFNPNSTEIPLKIETTTGQAISSSLGIALVEPWRVQQLTRVGALSSDVPAYVSVPAEGYLQLSVEYMLVNDVNFVDTVNFNISLAD